MHRKILLLEDEPDGLDQYRDSLAWIGDPGCGLIHTASISDAIALIETERPDCTLISWSLPGNGAVVALHRIHTRYPFMPLIVVKQPGETSYQLEELKQAGDCEVLNFPPTRDALRSAIDRATQASETRRNGARVAARSRTVLIIDDSPDDREVCSRALASADEDYRILEAAGGEAGLGIIEQDLPDCVLLDYSLPGKSGLEVLRRIQAVDAFMPVLMMTGRGDEAIAVKAIKGGAQNYLVKTGLTPAYLQQAVASAIEHSVLERRIAEQREQLYEQRLALAETSRLTAAVLDSAPCMIAVTDLDGKILVYNKELERVVGYSANEVIGKHTPRLWSPEAPILRRAERVARRKAGLPVEGDPPDGAGEDRSKAREAVFIRKDGAKVPVSLWVRNLRDSDGEVVGFLGLGEDITERKAHLEALKTSEETFRSAMEYAPGGMALIGLDGRFLQVNRALCDMVGCAGDELLARTLAEVTHAEDLGKDAEQHRQLVAGEIPSYSAEIRLTGGHGTAVDTQLHLSLVRGPSGEPKYFVAQVQDIRKRKEIDRLKAEFIAVFSHELRTPLASIRGALGLLASEAAERTAANAQLVDIARRNCERLLVLINDILDISRLESSKMRFDMQPARLDGLVREAVDANRSLAEEFKVSLAFETPEDIVLTVDATRFVQVLSNFIANAVKFSPAGASVQVSVRRQGARARIRVTDQGPGIPDSFRGRLFQKFSQADTSTSRRAGGSGLGLYISKQLTERMDGIIGVDSAEGQGSTFWVEFPIPQEAREDAPLAAASR